MARLAREEVQRIIVSAQKKGKIPDLRRVNLIQVDLSQENLGGVDFTEAKLISTNFLKANLSGANLKNADLSRANLREADLSGADLRGAKLAGADLSGANLFETNLFRADLTKANLRGAHLILSNLMSANLSEIYLTEAKVRQTIFGNVDLSTATGLNTIQHEGPSTIGIDTLLRSKGKIPEEFLRGVGVSDTFLTYITSLTGEAIQYYSCFISYSSKDEAFAQRLHADLQQKGVRCWFAQEDMKIGDPIRPRIDESIRVHDKLLLILSEHSINSRWVEKEVETAFEEEHRRHQTVLFPIRLDNAVMEANQAWAADIRRTRHIGDFSKWKDHHAYQKAFEWLLRDLKASE